MENLINKRVILLQNPAYTVYFLISWDMILSEICSAQKLVCSVYVED